MSKQNISRAVFNHTRSTRFQILAIAFITTGITASAWAWLGPASKAGSYAAATNAREISPPSSPAPSVAPQEETQIQAIVITVRAGWLEPSELTLPAGEYLLVVQNRSGLRDRAFRFDREAGERLVEVRDPQRKLDWSRRLRLTPGVYALSEADHPELNCRITITPN